MVKFFTRCVPARKTAKVTVNHPAHYRMHPVFTGECHDYAQHMTFDQGNAFKYLWRCAAKGDMKENTLKALWYLNDMRTNPSSRLNHLPPNMVDKLKCEVSTALDWHDKDTIPTKLKAALACYTAAACVAEGNVHRAWRLAKHALDHLNSMK